MRFLWTACPTRTSRRSDPNEKKNQDLAMATCKSIRSLSPSECRSLIDEVLDFCRSMNRMTVASEKDFIPKSLRSQRQKLSDIMLLELAKKNVQATNNLLETYNEIQRSLKRT